MNKVLTTLMAIATVSTVTVAKADTGATSIPKPQAAFIEEFDNTLAPLQYVKFCMNYRAECEASAAHQQPLPRVQAMRALEEVNSSVNQSIAPQRKSTDPMLAHWTVAPASGDCNDYAVTKRHELVARGWPQNALRLAVVRTGEGQGHLVLVVRLQDGDVVLDNLSPAVRNWNSLGYDWISMQSADNPRFWVAVNERGKRLRASRAQSTL